MQYKKTGNGVWLVKLETGDDPIKSLVEFARAESVCGFVNGIGALKWADIGYFDIAKKEYLVSRFDGYFELLSLSGNISFADGEPVVHLHILLGKPDCSVVGGHLVAGEVSVTGEIFVFPIECAALTRKINPDFNLKLWHFPE